MNLTRCFERKRKVRPLIIVQMDGLTRCELRLSGINKALPKQILQFENAIDPFSHRIVIAVANLAHTRLNLELAEALTIGVAGILNSIDCCV